MKRFVLHAVTGVALGIAVCTPLNQSWGATTGSEVVIENPKTPYAEGEVIFRASQLLGEAVKNSKGVYLGSCKDLVFGRFCGVTYLILERGSAFGAVGPLVAVPWTLVKVNKEDKSLLLDLPYDAVHDAPGFKLGKWPDFFSPETIQEIDQYYRRFK